jgi:hypothetical protein
MPRFGLDRRSRNLLLWAALLAFCLAQAMALVHASRHAGGDAAGLPGDRAQYCTDCATMLPLLAVAGGLGAAVAFLRPMGQALRAPVAIRQAAVPIHYAFRSRAPPR